jgi:hypothetical protein
MVSSSSFSLKGFTAIQIGMYFLLAAYLIKNILDGFLIDDNPMGMMSAQIIEITIISILIFVFLFSSLALFFSAKRRSKKLELSLWNPVSKNNLWRYLGSFLILFLLLYFSMNQGFIDLLSPIFMFFYALILFLINQKSNKYLQIISGICALLAVICFLIPSYWYASILILGIAHITFGIVVKD